MKKIIITAIACAVAAFVGTASAQDYQPIGYAHTVSFGAAYGYGSSPLANFVSGMVDINIPTASLPEYSYFRVRGELNGDQIKGNLGLSVGAGFQYMQHLTAGLYVYPFVQVKGEFHSDTKLWSKKGDFVPGLGAGLEYQFSSNIGAFVQGAYDYAVSAGASRPALKVGLVFAFGHGKTDAFASKKEKLAGVVASNAAQARAAKQAARDAEQRAAAEQIAAEKMRQEAAEAAAAAKFNDKATQNAYVEYQAGKPAAVSVPFVQGAYEVGNTSKNKILALVPYLLTHLDSNVEIMAYGDKLADKTDDTLAAKREKAVRDLLTSAGVSATRILTGKPTAILSVTTQPGSVAIVEIK